jgi:hypothetical protein
MTTYEIPKIFQKFGFSQVTTQPTRGDGNCFFHAFSVMFGQVTYQQARIDVVNNVHLSPNLNESNILAGEWSAKMAVDGEFADELVVTITALFYKIMIVMVYVVNGEVTGVSAFSHVKPDRMIVMVNLDNCHFESTVMNYSQSITTDYLKSPFLIKPSSLVKSVSQTSKPVSNPVFPNSKFGSTSKPAPNPVFPNSKFDSKSRPVFPNSKPGFTPTQSVHRPVFPSQPGKKEEIKQTPVEAQKQLISSESRKLSNFMSNSVRKPVELPIPIIKPVESIVLPAGNSNTFTEDEELAYQLQLIELSEKENKFIWPDFGNYGVVRTKRDM